MHMYTQYHAKSCLNTAEFCPVLWKFSLIIVPLKYILPKMFDIMTCITVKLSLLFCMFFYDAITTFSLYASTDSYSPVKLLTLLVRIEAIKMPKTGRLKAHPQSQASKKLCHIQTLGTCHQIEWNIKIIAQNAKEINSTRKTREGTDGQAYRRLNGLQFWFLKTC